LTLDGETMGLMFQALNWVVLPFWLLLLVAPGWTAGPRLVSGRIVPALLAACYVFLLFSGAGAAFVEPVPNAGDGLTLDAIMFMFTKPVVALLGWVHYLAFDLFVGAWEARDARERGVPHWLLAPCLILTFAVGPAGFLAYILIRKAAGRRALA
jgi:hypothetical protein